MNLNQLVRRNFSVTMEYPINFASCGWSLSKEGYNVGLGYWVNAKLSLESFSSSSSWNNDWPSVQILWPWKKIPSKQCALKFKVFFYKRPQEDTLTCLKYFWKRDAYYISRNQGNPDFSTCFFIWYLGNSWFYFFSQLGIGLNLKSNSLM